MQRKFTIIIGVMHQAMIAKLKVRVLSMIFATCLLLARMQMMRMFVRNKKRANISTLTSYGPTILALILFLMSWTKQHTIVVLNES